MSRALLILLLLAGLGVATPRSRAFTLIGEVPAWYTDNTGRIPVPDIYGPVNLGEEYRWAVPNIIYAFDESFLNYFGQRGVEEVEKAIKIINDVPKMSAVKLSDYPMHSQRVNYRARDLGLYDLKSNTLKVLMEQLGLGTPSRFTFTLRVRDTSIPNNTNYLVIQRNFDPETWNPTPYVNGQLWTYNRIFDNQDSPTVKSSTIVSPVDPLILAEPVASAVPGFAFSVFGLGSYITGLTRDDVGGLRYIYRPDNMNVEVLPTDATGVAGSSSGGGSSGSGGGGIDEWIPLPPSSGLTNGAAGGAGTGTGVVITTNGVFYTQAIRGGVDKITFVRGPMVYLPGAYSFTNRFTESIVAVTTNGAQRTVSQRVTRLLTTPDIIFTAADLTSPTGVVTPYSRTDVATSNDAINGQATLDGPGQFGGGLQITFNKVGATLQNFAPSFLGQASAFGDVLWGAFDGSTNDPVVFPDGSSIRDLEKKVFGGR